MTLDQALANAARCLEAAEGELPERAETLNETAHHWLEMANLLFARESPICR